MAVTNILVDTTIIVIILGSLYEGYRRGLVTTLLGLVGFATVLLLCLAFGETLSKPLKPYIPLPVTYAALAAYIAICFAIALLAYLLHSLFSGLLKKKVPPGVDAVGGMLVGALRGAVFTALTLVILMLIANPTIHDNITIQSRIGATFFKEVSKVSPTVNEIFESPPSPLRTMRVEKKKSEYESVVDSFPRKSDKKK